MIARDLVNFFILNQNANHSLISDHLCIINILKEALRRVVMYHKYIKRSIKTSGTKETKY